jgi:hypothetical protein
MILLQFEIVAEIPAPKPSDFGRNGRSHLHFFSAVISRL